MRFCALVVAVGILGWACGCGGAKDDRPARAPTSVTVTYQGAPVEGANVTLSPQGGGKPAFGLTDQQGVAQLSTFGQGDGALPGEYQVAIQKTKVEGTAADPNNMVPTTTSSKTVDLLPAKYASPKTSGLKASVTTGNNKLTFELKD